MRILRNIVATLLLIIFMLFSIVGLMIYMPSFGGRFSRINETGRGIMNAWQTHPGSSVNNLFWVWLGVFFGCLLAFLLSFAARRRRARIEVQMGDGRVVVLESAIKKYIRTALGDIPDVTHKRVDLRQARNGIEARIYAQVRTHEKLPDLERQIIRRVRQALSDELGITSISSVQVFIKDFEVRPKPTVAPEQLAAAPTSPEPAPRPVPPIIAPPPPVQPPPPAEQPVWHPAPAPEIDTVEETKPEPVVASYTPETATEQVVPQSEIAGESSVAEEQTVFAAPEEPESETLPQPLTTEDLTEAPRGFFSRWKRKNSEPPPEPDAPLSSEMTEPDESFESPGQDINSADAENKDDKNVL